MDFKETEDMSEEERDALHLMIQWSLEYLYPSDVHAIMQKIWQNEKPIRLLALDCEFIRTVNHACSLARLTVSERYTDETWDIIVKQNPKDICDLRTNITGLNEKSFEGSDCADLYGVRRKLRNLISDNKYLVILVCHDFRRDLKVLNLHQDIKNMGCGLIDTSVIFYFDVEGAQQRKPGLSDLYSMLLNSTLREPNAVHDSVQDCEATLAVFEKALDFVKQNKQRVNLSPPPEITRKWDPQFIFDVSGVNIRTTELVLSSHEHFGRFGEIKRIKFLYNHKSRGGFRGRCTVIYHSHVELDPTAVLMGMNQKLVDGHYISVKINKWSKSAPSFQTNYDYNAYQQQQQVYWDPQTTYYSQPPTQYGYQYKPERYYHHPPGYRSMEYGYASQGV